MSGLLRGACHRAAPCADQQWRTGLAQIADALYRLNIEPELLAS